MAEVSTKDGKSLPYVMASGNIKKTLDEVIKASVPDRFTQDFLSTKLGIKGGPAKMVIPFLKKTGFLNSDGTVTEIYQDFRIDSTRHLAANNAILEGYSVLHEMNEYFYELDDQGLKDIVVRATGFKKDSSTVRAIVASIKALVEYADFSKKSTKPLKAQATKAGKPEESGEAKIKTDESRGAQHKEERNRSSLSDFKLGYTININLPSTSDIAVYNAIFKSLRDNILDE